MKIITQTFLSAILSFPYLAQAAYVLQEDYTPQNFFDKFNFFTGPDPTHGFVTYVDKDTAAKNKYIRRNTNKVYIGVDYKTKVPFNPADKHPKKGRQSVRIESKTVFTKGLFILDVEHMPGGICGTWPAFWTVGGQWPNNGEIDIIEGVHRNTQNMMALHTGPQCSVRNQGQTALMEAGNCDVKAPGQDANQGCSMKDNYKTSVSYGEGFNKNKGGVYAMEWTSKYIRIWFFPRNAIPKDINKPDPSKWGTPNANFQGGCDFDKKFKNHKIIFNTTFCGDWAGGVWGNQKVAPGWYVYTLSPIVLEYPILTRSSGGKTESCIAYVANNPQHFAKAFWTVRSLKVYKKNK